jgi:hypothetical protein
MGGGGGGTPPPPPGEEKVGDGAETGDLIPAGAAKGGGGDEDSCAGVFTGAFFGAILPNPFLGAFLGGGGGGGPEPGLLDGGDPNDGPFFGGTVGAFLAGGANLA